MYSTDSHGISGSVSALTLLMSPMTSQRNRDVLQGTSQGRSYYGSYSNLPLNLFVLRPCKSIVSFLYDRMEDYECFRSSDMDG